MSATVALGSVQKNAIHPFGSSTSTTRVTPPTGRHVASNVLYRFTAVLPYNSNVPVVHPRFCPARLANAIRLSPYFRFGPRLPAGRLPGTPHNAASLRSRLTTTTPDAISGLSNAAFA